MKACFTGHRTISAKELPWLKQQLNSIIKNLVYAGVDSFLCGGAIGFDMLAGYTVLDFKNNNKSIKLIMILPCHNQDLKWPASEKKAYKKLLALSDEVIYVSTDYFDGCMNMRNIFLVENSDICIAYMKSGRSGTAQTLRLAKEKGIEVYNLAR